MMKKLFFIFQVFFTVVFPQQQNPNVELPDFIIMGTDVVSVKIAQKAPPEFVSTISEQFIKPVFSPEELEVRDISFPLKDDLNIFDSLHYHKGRLEFNAGIYLLPLADISYLFPINDIIAEATFTGENHRPHVGNSDRYLINGGINLLYTTPNNSEIFPGTQLKFNGNFGSESYKFYSISTPPRRTLNQGKFAVSVSNRFGRQFNFDLKIQDDISSISEENYSENILGINFFSRAVFSSFNAGVSAEYKNQSLTIDPAAADTPNSDVNDYVTLKPFAGVSISEVIKLSGGVTYSKSGGRSFTAPFAALSFKINKYFSLFGEYSPHGVFLTSSELLKVNRYYNPQNFYNHFYKKSNSFTAAAKYEYDKYYQINAGVKYFSSSEYPFFNDDVSTGMFRVASADINSLTFFADLLFHPGPNGVMYGNIELNDIKDNNSKSIPYHPDFKASVLYGYQFNFGLNAQIGLTYFSRSFTDIQNIETIPSHFYLRFKLLYEIFDNFFITGELNNILNDNIYYWKGYKETPLDVIGGFRFLW